MGNNVELVVDAQAKVGEGPCWDSEKNVLYWVDILNYDVHVYNPKNGENQTINTGQYVGAAVKAGSDKLLLAMHYGFYFLVLQSEKLELIEEPEKNIPGNRFNDGKCDPAGRFWAGTMDLEQSNPTGSLYCLDTNRHVRKVLGDLTISNGLAWSPDHKTMYFIDSPTKQVVAFNYDIQTGEIENPKVVVNIPDGEGIPDGMTIDSEGKLWIAQFGGAKVSRWDPNTGQLLSTIPVPASQVTSCTFGGPQLDKLYITTARVGLDAEDLAKEPYAGGLFHLKTNITGQPSYQFGN